MIISDIIFALLIAIVVTSLFVWLKFRKEKRIWEKRIWPFFLAIFLATWATSIWITPNGLVAAQYAWIPMFIAGIILAIVITTFLPTESEKDLDKEEKPSKSNMKNTNIWFWVLILILIIPIILGYVTH